jgi:hypothetical protein
MQCVTPYTRSGSFQIRIDPYWLEIGHVSIYLTPVSMQETYGCIAHPSKQEHRQTLRRGAALATELGMGKLVEYETG